jgi:hypothetical protein
MLFRCAIGAVALLAVQSLATADAFAFDPSKYPDWKGQWIRIGAGTYDPTKKAGLGQEPPLTPEYRAIWEKNLAEEARGGQSYNPQARCLSGGMPRMMIVYEPMEIIITPETTYIWIGYMSSEFRRIYTDGRSRPKEVELTFAGYSIGQWVDESGSGRYDTLLVETRGMRGPRVYEASGIPLHKDNQTIVKERIRLDKANPNILLNEITTIDNALTRPWTITRQYRRERNPNWVDYSCSEDNMYVYIENETYFIGADGRLMPTGKDQPPPDLRHFNRAQKK